jgi:hypothetical protein
MNKQNQLAATLLGDNLTLSINGMFYSKSKTNDSAIYDMVRNILSLPFEKRHDEIEKLINLLNPKLAIYDENFLYDKINNQYYLKGYEQMPVPETLINTFFEYKKENFPITALINFWKLLMTNPDKNVIESLFNHLKQSKYAITDYGYCVGYKKVRIKKVNKNSNVEETQTVDYKKFVIESVNKIKKQKQAYKNYVIIQKNGNVFELVKANTKLDKDIIFAKNLLDAKNEQEPEVKIGSYTLETDEVYTDIHTGTFNIVLGEVVKEVREKCNPDPKVACSNGLHIGTDKYVKGFSGSGYDYAVLACFFNPSHVVSVPNDCNQTKIRVCEYYPYAKLGYDNKTGDFTLLETKYFETDYLNYEIDEVNKIIDTLPKDSILRLISEERQLTYKDRNVNVY